MTYRNDESTQYWKPAQVRGVPADLSGCTNMQCPRSCMRQHIALQGRHDQSQGGAPEACRFFVAWVWESDRAGAGE
jgi:hypothetical protein